METPSAIMVNLPESFGGKEAKELGRALQDKITSNAPCVIVDLSRVKKMDSAGLEGLLGCMQEVARHDGSMQLGAVSPEAATLLELARMHQLFGKFSAIPAEAQSFAVAANAVADDTVELTPEATAQPQPVAA